ncbi:NT1 family protein [Megaselia abdita]
MELRKICVLCCVIFGAVLAAEEELFDFDFGDSESATNFFEESARIENVDNFVNFDIESPKAGAFDKRQKIVSKALTKALKDKTMRRRFTEIMPILRILSGQQKLALSALISTQVQSKAGQELKYDQVRSMFGDDEKLTLPIIFDIANLVKTAADKYLRYEHEMLPTAAPKQEPLQTISSRRNIDLTSTEEVDDFLEDPYMEPKLINEALIPKPVVANSSRSKRSTEFVHKLVRAIPLNHETNQLNTTQFLGPYDYNPETPKTIAPTISTTVEYRPTKQTTFPSDAENTVLDYNQVEDLALADLNGTDSDQRPMPTASPSNGKDDLPAAEELVGGPHIRGPNKIRYNTKPPRGPPPGLSIGPIRPSEVYPKRCERFTASMCIRADDYPLEQIMGSIRRHKHAMTALLAEYRDKSAELEYQEYLEELQLSKKRREDENTVTPGGLCSSVVRYARPQKARSAAGEWKYIVNTGQHTQTLRLEKCSNPQESCSYLSQNYRSRCVQIYNYHRLLSWDKNRGLHVDIYKVPTCCSCHVDGYKEIFPPLSNKYKDFTPATYQHKKPTQYTTLTDELDYEDEEGDDNDDIAYHYSNGFKRVKSHQYDPQELLISGSKKRSKVVVPKHNPTIASFLSPPGGTYQYKRDIDSAAEFSNLFTRVRKVPYQQQSEERADLGTSESEKVEVDDGTTTTGRRRIPAVLPTSNIPTKSTSVSYSIPILTPTPSPKTMVVGLPMQEKSSELHHVRKKPIFSTKYSDTNKRVNYNYHPIIDYFENQMPRKVPSGRVKIIPPHPKDRRMSYQDPWLPMMDNR